MIDRGEILEVASVRRLRPDVVEKDYVLGWVLAGIFSHPTLAPAWVFKGGTCLKKCYVETYRFSEDLDFTIEDDQQMDEGFLREAFSEVSEWIYDQTGIELPPSDHRFEVYRNRRGGLNVEGCIYYRGPMLTRGSLPRVKLDLTTDEHLVYPPTWRAVTHNYTDGLEDVMSARCYAFEEVFGEKVRALAERARPRDLYDVIILFWNHGPRLESSAVQQVVREKCNFKGIPVPSIASLEPFKDELTGDWEAMLGHQLPALPPLEAFWSAVPEFFDWLQTGVTPIVPDGIPLQDGEEVTNDAAEPFELRPGVASILQVIRFAAVNRLCVDLLYAGTIHRVEPYSLRRPLDGASILYACPVNDMDCGMYLVESIQEANTTSESFKPQYANELGPILTLSIPNS